MHLVVIRREVYNSHHWVAQSLLKAFTASVTYDALSKTAALQTIARCEVGGDWWMYRFDANRDVI